MFRNVTIPKPRRLVACAAVVTVFLYQQSTKMIDMQHSLDGSYPNLKEDQGTIQCNGSSCTDSAGIQGEWVLVGSNRSFAAPVCCSWHHNNNGALCGKKPATTDLYSGNDNAYQHLGGNGCSCDKFTDNYEWKSPTLSSPFDPIATCSLLGESPCC
jgi:hypothetical protein